jgi:hypothetical protein
MDPDPGGLKTCGSDGYGSGFGSGSATLHSTRNVIIIYKNNRNAGVLISVSLTYGPQ